MGTILLIIALIFAFITARSFWLGSGIYELINERGEVIWSGPYDQCVRMGTGLKEIANIGGQRGSYRLRRIGKMP